MYLHCIFSQPKISEGRKQPAKRHRAKKSTSTSPRSVDGNVFQEDYQQWSENELTDEMRQWREGQRMKSPVLVDTCPAPKHNFPTPLCTADQDADWHPFIEELNQTTERLMGIQANMWGDSGIAQIVWLKRMKEVTQNIIPRLTSKLAYLPMIESEAPSEALDPGIRDALVNIGAGFFLCGLYLIMMGSNEADGDEAICANHYLQKAFHSRNNYVCRTCGHKNCSPVNCSNPSSDDRQSIRMV